jgi:hypothetical protein
VALPDAAIEIRDAELEQVAWPQVQSSAAVSIARRHQVHRPMVNAEWLGHGSLEQRRQPLACRAADDTECQVDSAGAIGVDRAGIVHNGQVEDEPVPVRLRGLVVHLVFVAR